MAKGWNTTDEDEIKVRQKRALKDDFEITNLKKKQKVFSSYKVQSKNSIYFVEIRSFEENINSCSCPDIAVNRLGTCKHIEAVKLQFKNQTKKNKNIEIYHDMIEDKIKILFPKGSRKKSFPREELAKYFTASGELLFEPTIAFKSLKRVIDGFDEVARKKIRVSRLIEPWLKLQEFKKEKIENRKLFLQDYKDGKRSFEFLKHSLFDYQKEGVLHLAFGERALLADDMGLGKTIQAIGATILLKRVKNIQKVLVITPASLKAQWEEEIENFTDESATFIFGNRKKREEKYKQKSFFYLANYEQILYDFETINNILQPDVIILDEAQRIKNWKTKTANSIKRLKSRYAFVLTGTPIENRIDEIYSIVQFLDPTIFGPLFRFNREFYKLDENGLAIGYKNMNLLHQRLKPIMIRRKKDEIEEQLPQRIDKTYLVQMDDKAQDMYDEYELTVSRIAAKAKKFPLSPDDMKRLQLGLSCMRILCDTAYILDQRIFSSPKIDELIPILEELLEEKNRKIIIFSQWEKMLELLNFTLEKKSIKVAWHTGSYNQLQRKEQIKKFKTDTSCNILLSTDSGSVGLNLQIANVVINLDMPWNPAILEQRISRAWRKYQKNTVQVINLVTENRLEHRIVEIVKQKQFLSDNVLDGLGKDELNLPSSRQRFLEDIEKVLPVEGEQEIKSVNKDNPKHFTQDLLSTFSDRIKEVSFSKSSSTMFVVVDKKDEKLHNEIIKNQNQNLKDSKIEILQKDEYELIKKLIASGMIELKGDLESLYQPSKLQKNQLQESEIIKIKEIFTKTKRKYDMAKLLFSGGFKEESLTTYCEVVNIGKEIVNLLKDGSFDEKFIKQIDKSEDLDIDFVVNGVKKFFDRLKILIESKVFL